MKCKPPSWIFLALVLFATTPRLAAQQTTPVSPDKEVQSQPINAGPAALSPKEMLSELRADKRELTRFLRLAHEVCEDNDDVATASLIENWIDQTERRT